MAGLRHVGRPPDSDASLMTVKDINEYNVSVAVTELFVTDNLATEIATAVLKDTTYVDAQDALRAQKTDVDAADLNYFATTTLNAASGVAGLDSEGNVISGQIPAGLVTDRVAKAYSATAPDTEVFLTTGETQQVNNSSIRNFKIASLVIPDPGYPWVPLPFAMVMGKTVGTSPGDRWTEGDASGKLLVMQPEGDGDAIYGYGLCTGVYNQNRMYAVVPYAAQDFDAGAEDPLEGGITLDLYGSCYEGSGYVFTGTGLFYQVLVLPAI